LAGTDEGILSFDPILPLKPHLGADYDSLVSRLRAAIETRYAIPAWDDESYAAHERADRLAAASVAGRHACHHFLALMGCKRLPCVPVSRTRRPETASRGARA
jgi:hypothetical protein